MAHRYHQPMPCGKTRGWERTELPPRVVYPHPGVPTLVPTCHSKDQEGEDSWDAEGAGSKEEEEKDGPE